MQLKLMIGAEFSNIDHKDIRDARNSFETSINSLIETQDYDIELRNFGYVMVLMPKEDREVNYREVIRYSTKTKLINFKLHLDYDLFKSSDILTRQKLIYQGLVRTLDILEQKGLNKTALDELRQDILSVAQENGWIDE